MPVIDPTNPDIATFKDDAGRTFNYVPLRYAAADLAIHFSAFFGEWGDAKPYRDTFQGYYHRLKMLGGESAHDWLFMCDQYGAEGNGTYYTGEKGEFFVERATLAIIRQTMGEWDHPPERTVLLGSSMGATAALKFGLMLGVRGIVIVSPHIDLDISAARQNRERHVAFLVPDGDTQSPNNYRYTRQVRNLLRDHPTGTPLPRLFVQACRDDQGVYDEQVLPLIEEWRAKGGKVWLDTRPVGGHTSDWATKAILLDATDALLHDRDIDVGRYQADPAFLGALVTPPLSHRLRRRASLLRKRLLRRS
ncbi:MAG: Two component regulator three Y domain-containing protein [Acidimicrobiia bacterium]|nr:Two component regulator three Y domain-containing protein [Acidimicrobiia bacterium]